MSGCGGIGTLPTVLPEQQQPATPSPSGEVASPFDNDQWVARQDWTPRQGAIRWEKGMDPERFVRWQHPATKAIRAELERQKQQVAIPVESRPVRRRRAADPEQAVAAPVNGPAFDWLELMDRDTFAGWNAMILYARYFPTEGAEYLPLLVEMVVEPLKYQPVGVTLKPGDLPPESRTTINFRAAAAEACCLTLLSERVEDLQQNLNRVLELAERDNLPDEVRVELFHGLSRVLPPRDIPHLTESLQPLSSYRNGTPAPKAEVRLAALDACLIHDLLNQGMKRGDAIEESWPPNLLNLRNDPDYRLRIKIGQLVALGRHSSGWPLLHEQLNDAEVAVRHEALVSLGRLGTPEAREELRVQMKDPGELTRVAAIKGLACYGAEDLKPGATDESPHVRREVARQLAQYQDYESALVLRGLLVDPNPQVQLEAVQALVYWPDSPAVGLLIHALQESSTPARQSALTSLEARAGKALMFPLHASREERLRASEKMSREWPTELRGSPPTRSPVVSDTPNDPRRIEELQSDLRELATLDPLDPRGAAIQQKLMDLRPTDVEWLERYAGEGPVSQREWIQGEVLPKLSRTYARLAEMEKADILDRRRGAERLASEANAHPLRPTELSRLEGILAREQDAMVWRFAMLAIEKDPSPHGARIAQMAANHTWPDIRILGCQHIARHGGPDQALWLMPLFADSNPQVQGAAVDAATHCRNPIVVDGLPGQPGGGVRPLLTTGNTALRVKVAACLSQFGDQQGIGELQRLARDPDWNIRYQAIQAMGAGGQTRFVGTLTQLGWAEKHPSVQRALLQSLAQLVPETQRPPELSSSLTPDKQIEIWVTWWSRQGGNRETRTADSFGP